MKKTVNIGILLSVFLMLMIPNVSAIEFHHIKEIQDSIIQNQLNQFEKRFEKYDIVFPTSSVGMIIIVLSFIFIVISDILSVLGWMLLGAWDSSVGLGIAVIASGIIGGLISLLLLFIGCVLSPGSMWLIIPAIIALSPAYVPALIWLLSPIFIPSTI